MKKVALLIIVTAMALTVSVTGESKTASFQDPGPLAISPVASDQN